MLEPLKDPAGQLEVFADRLSPAVVELFFRSLQQRFLEVFHPWLITSRARQG